MGKLIYLTATQPYITTRPDITYVMNLLSQFMHQPKKLYVEAIQRLIIYLNGSREQDLYFEKNNHLQVWGYSDVDQVGSLDDHRSTTRYCCYMGVNLIS